MGRAKDPRKVNRYSAELKLKAVKLSQRDGVKVQDVAEALDIHPFMLSRWRKDVAKRVEALHAGAVEPVPWEALRSDSLARIRETPAR